MPFLFYRANGPEAKKAKESDIHFLEGGKQ